MINERKKKPINKTETDTLIQELKSKQARYNQELNNIIERFKSAQIGHTARVRMTSKQFTVGNQVKIMNPGLLGGKKGTIVKVTKTRVTVKTSKGKVVRAYKNIERINMSAAATGSQSPAPATTPSNNSGASNATTTTNTNSPTTNNNINN